MAVAWTGSSTAQPTSAHEPTPSSVAVRGHVDPPKRPPVLFPTTQAVTYSQALRGFHGASTRPAALDEHGRPMLVLTTINRNETLAVATFDDEGGFSAADLERLAYLLRSAEGAQNPMDPRTLGLVYRIQRHFDVPEIRVVSGYRLPKPASHSNHGLGRAIDLIVPGVTDEDVAKYARQFGFVGVGIYPTSQFVHLDIRTRSYFWVDTSAPHRRNRERGILRDLAAKSDAAALARGQTPIERFAIALNVDSALEKQEPGTPDVHVEEEDEDDLR
jgi:uncharacterized protein YcbK (DUF882 family)